MTYNFLKLPTNLFFACDGNCRTMLATLIQLSSIYGNEDGWFFRSYADLEKQTKLSQNLVKVTLQTLYNHNIIDAIKVGQARGKHTNQFKINWEKVEEYDRLSIEDAISNPTYAIETLHYKTGKFSFKPNEGAKKGAKEGAKKGAKSDNNIDNKDNKESLFSLIIEKENILSSSLLHTECKEKEKENEIEEIFNFMDLDEIEKKEEEEKKNETTYIVVERGKEKEVTLDGLMRYCTIHNLEDSVSCVVAINKNGKRIENNSYSPIAV